MKPWGPTNTRTLFPHVNAAYSFRHYWALTLKRKTYHTIRVERKFSYCRMLDALIAVLKCHSNSKSSCEACILESIVGWMWMQLRLGFSVACLTKDMVCLLREQLTKSIGKGTCIIYSQGLERPTKMSGNKASCYFLTAVQTWIDKNLALQIKMRLWVADDKTYWALLSGRECTVCPSFGLRDTSASLEKYFPLQKALKLPCPEENIHMSPDY